MAIEVFGSRAANRISEIQNSVLNKEAGEARTNAASAILLSQKIGTTNALLLLKVEELRQKNDDFALKQWPRAQRFDMNAAGYAIDGYKGKTKPKLVILYPANNSETWQLALRIKLSMEAHSWPASIRAERSEDVPTGWRAWDDTNAPVDVRFGLGMATGALIIVANPIYDMDVNWIMKASSVFTNTGWNTNVGILIPHTSNPIVSISAALMAGGVSPISTDWDKRLDLDVIEIVVSQKYWQ